MQNLITCAKGILKCHEFLSDELHKEVNDRLVEMNQITIQEAHIALYTPAYVAINFDEHFEIGFYEDKQVSIKNSKVHVTINEIGFIHVTIFDRS